MSNVNNSWTLFRRFLCEFLEDHSVLCRILKGSTDPLGFLNHLETDYLCVTRLDHFDSVWMEGCAQGQNFTGVYKKLQVSMRICKCL